MPPTTSPISPTHRSLQRRATRAASVALLAGLAASCSATAVSPTTIASPVAPTESIAAPDLASSTTTQGVPDTVTVSPGEPWLVYSWFGPGTRNRDLFLALTDGTNGHSILPDLPGDQSSPSWSPDGSRIAFKNTDDVTPDGSIWTVNADGSDPMFLTDGNGACPGGIHYPDWSPDGSTLAVICYADLNPGGGSVATFDIATGTLTRLNTVTWPEHIDGAPSWSPDGSAIAFYVLHWDPTDQFVDGSLVAVVPADGGPEQRLTGFDTNMAGPDWSPDGSELVMHTNDLGNIHTTDQPSNIYAIKPDGTGQRQITKSSVDGTMRIVQPRWSLDGSRIVVSVGTASAGNTIDDVQLAFVDPNGGEPVLISPTIHGLAPDLRPSSTSTDTATSTEQWFASNWDSEGIRLTRRDGSSSIEVLTELSAGTAPWNPDWSPDGNQLVANITVDPSGAILIADLDGQHQQVISCDPPCLGFGAPSWSRDGRKIAFAQASESGSNITVFDVASGIATNVLELDEPGRDIDMVRWSPTDEELVGIYNVWNADDDTQLESASLVIVSVADGAFRELTKLDGFESFPDWHPSNDLIVFVREGASGSLDDDGQNLFTIRSDGSGLTQITHFPPGELRAGQPTWAPDGTFIVFTLGTYPNLQIATISADGSNLTDLSVPGSHNRLRPRP